MPTKSTVSAGPSRCVNVVAPVPAAVMIVPLLYTSRTRLSPCVVISIVPSVAKATPKGMLSVALMAGPPSPVLPCTPPSPAMIVTPPSLSMRRMTWFPLSANTMKPPVSMVMPPPPLMPLASVVMMPVVLSTRRTRVFSVKMTAPSEGRTTTPSGMFTAAAVAGPPSPAPP